MSKLKHMHTSALLDELIDRLCWFVMRAGREDLVKGICLLDRMLPQDTALLRPHRERLLTVLSVIDNSGGAFPTGNSAKVMREHPGEHAH